MLLLYLNIIKEINIEIIEKYTGKLNLINKKMKYNNLNE